MSSITYAWHMDRGHALLDHNELFAAISNFMAANALTENAAERTRALQMTGVTFRKIGNIAKAVEYGEKAVEEAKLAESPRSTSGAARDLAASLHVQGVAAPDGRAAILRQALSLYDLSLEYEALGAKHRLPGMVTATSSEEYAVTEGMRGLLLYDMAHYRIWINDDGSGPARLGRHEAKRAQNEAVKLIKRADFILHRRDNRIWELNNLLKLIQVTPLPERAPLVHRAEQLIAGNKGRTKDLWVAMTGRRAMRLAIKLQVKRWRS